MSVYRTPAPPHLERWNVTPRRKWYVKIVRLFVNLRAKYAERREYNQYLRDLEDWKREYAQSRQITGKSMLVGAMNGRPLPRPPMPLPPPARIME